MSKVNAKQDKLLASFERKLPHQSVSEKNSPLARVQSRFALADQVAAEATQEGPGKVAALTARDSTAAPNQWGGAVALPEDLSPNYRAWCLANNYQPGTAIDVALSALKDSPYNPRHFYPVHSLQPLLANIAESGQQTPIHVIPDYDQPGTFFVSDGGRRLRVCRQLKHQSCRAIVVDVPIGIQSYKLGYDLNTQHEAQTTLDDAVKWRRMLDEGLFASQRELGDALGVDEVSVALTLSLAKLPESVMLEMLQSPKNFGRRMSYEVWRFFEREGGDVEGAIALVRRIIRDDLSVRQVQRTLADDVISPSRQPGPRRVVATQRVAYKLPNGRRAGELKLYGDDRIDLQLRGLPKETRDALHERIEDVLKELQRPAKGSHEIN